MQSFLICHIGALGDFILTWPALKCLRGILSDYNFHGVGKPAYMKLGHDMGLLDSYFDMDAVWMVDFFSGKSIPSPLPKSQGAVLWLNNAEAMVKMLRESATLPVVAISPFATEKIHVAEYYCLTIQNYWPIKPPTELASLFPSQSRDNKYIVIHPGSGSIKKNFSPEFYLDISREITSITQQEVCYIFGPVEIEQNLQNKFKGEWIVESQNLKHFINLLKCASLFIGNDSGVSHLAGILGIPTIALYKITDPVLWGVIGKQVKNLSIIDERLALNQIKEIIENWL